MLHAVDTGDETLMKTGLRVKARWRAERKGQISDIECFEIGDAKQQQQEGKS